MSQKKILRLGFAMGGGVSLGAYSGSGLAEVIKLMILHGGKYISSNSEGNYDFHKYETIVIDVFSGSSAGAISLAIMLRCLSDPLSMLPHLFDENSLPENYQMLWNRWEEELYKEYDKKALNNLDVDGRNNFLSAEIVQRIQYKIWVEEASIQNLAKVKQKDQLKSASILNRGFLKELIKKYGTKNVEGKDFNDFKMLLADRILFCCSLTNLNYLLYGNDNTDAESHPTHEAVLDGMTSKSHKELRIFDIKFTEADELLKIPKNWIDIRNVQERDKVIDSDEFIKYFKPLQKEETWQMIFDSALACGSFPFAFDPMQLKRYNYEYLSRNWPKDIKGFIKDNQEEEEYYPFSYVDGGTFNNEPIREAFRMAHFLDYCDKDLADVIVDDKAERDFDRLIVYIDPIIGAQSVNYNIKLYDALEVRNSGIKTVPEISRMLNHAGSFVGVLRNEASVKESNKINKVRNNLQLRDKLFRFLSSIEVQGSQNDDLIRSIFKKILEENESELIPNVIVKNNIEGIQKEKERPEHSRRESPDTEAIDISDNEKEYTRAIIQEEIQEIIGPGKKRLSGLNEERTDKKDNMRLKVALSVLILHELDIEGKDAEAMLLAIGPSKFRSINGREDAEIIDLPGGEIEGFAGFASEELRNKVAQFARYNVYKYLNWFNDNKNWVEQNSDFDWSAEKLPSINKNTYQGNSEITTYDYDYLIKHREKNLKDVSENMYKGIRSRLDQLLKQISKQSIRNWLIVFLLRRLELTEKKIIKHLDDLLSASGYESSKVWFTLHCPNDWGKVVQARAIRKSKGSFNIKGQIAYSEDENDRASVEFALTFRYPIRDTKEEVNTGAFFLCKHEKKDRLERISALRFKFRKGERYFLDLGDKNIIAQAKLKRPRSKVEHDMAAIA